MPPARLQVVAHITARRESVDEVRAVLERLVPPTRAEAGCLRYELFQNQADPTDFTFVEEWAGDDALDAHLRTPHVSAALARAASLLAAAPDIRRYRLIV